MAFGTQSPSSDVTYSGVIGLTPGTDVSLTELRSSEPESSRDAWNAAYPLLWSAGIRLASRLLSGGQWEAQRQDVVATAISQVVEGLIEGKSEIFNQMHEFSDLVSMTQTFVRRRVVDFLRKKSRTPEDAVEEIPEISAPGENVLFTQSELKAEIAALDPPKPKLFFDRFFQGLTTREVAERHGMAHGTVLTHFADGLRLLRERLSRQLP